jgi:K+-transporting ATPase ATPase C chain
MTTFLRRVLWPAFALLVVMTLITGVAYPAAVTAIAQVAFPHQANGSMLVAKDGRTVGSTLIGQAFSGDTYFWGRPSAAGATDDNPLGYDASGSAGSNLGPTNPDLIDRVNDAVAAYQAANPGVAIPVDLITTSASGLDPDISPASAEYQVARVAAARGKTADEVRALVARHTDQPLLGIFGQPAVHVLELNLDLDGLLQ